MNRVGVRELGRVASGILRRVSAGETEEATDRGRPVAVMLRTMPNGLARLETEGMLRRGTGNLLESVPIKLRQGSDPPSRLVDEGRAD